MHVIHLSAKSVYVEDLKPGTVFKMLGSKSPDALWLRVVSHDSVKACSLQSGIVLTMEGTEEVIPFNEVTISVRQCDDYDCAND